MKNLVLFLASLLMFTSTLTAQVAINSTGDEPDPSAILDLQSTTKGFLVPRVTSSERNLIGTTQSGLLVYDTTTESFWYYDNSQAGWVELGGGSDVYEINDLSDGIYDGSSVFLGNSSGTSDDGFNNNVGIGKWALWKNTSGQNNVSLGLSAVRENTTGSNNIGIGTGANLYNITGNNNTAIGYYAGLGNWGASFSGCVFLGHESGRYNTSDNKLYIDNSNTSSPLIGGDFSTNHVDINGTIKITGGTPGTGKVLTSDADGDASWETPTAFASAINDLSDGKTDEESVFLGTEAGNSDDGDNYNVAIGIQASKDNIGGKRNAALGNAALKRNYNGSDLVAIGDSALYNNYYSGAYTYSYSNRNTAIGSSSLFTNERGEDNTAIGYRSLYKNYNASDNTAIGAKSLYTNSSGTNNTAVGNNSLYSTTSGDNNVALGVNTGQYNTIGSNNISVGAYAMMYNSTGSSNTAIGFNAGKGTTGNNISGCVFLGYEAGKTNTSDNKLFIDNSSTSTPLIGGDFSTNQVNINGTIKITGGVPGANKVLTSDADGLATWETPTSYATSLNDLSDAIWDGASIFIGDQVGTNDDGTNYNTALGDEAFKSNISGRYNTALGYKTLENSTGDGNTGVGQNCLRNTSTGNYNTAIGQAALYSNTTGTYNAAFGYNSNYKNTTGLENAAFGRNSLYNNTTGGGNVAIGHGALEDNVTGHWNTAVGHSAYVASGSYLNSTAIGYNSPISGSNQIHLGNTSITEIKGQVSFTTYSDGRIKDNIKENVGGLDFILKLRPVTYNINLDRENQILGITDDFDLPNKYDIEKVRKTGFIAQEVEAAADETNYDFSGIQKPKNENDLYGLSYSEFVVPLVKGMQEQQQQIKNQQQQIEILNKEISELKALTEKLLNQR